VSIKISGTFTHRLTGCPVIQESRAPPRPQRLCRIVTPSCWFSCRLSAADGFRRAAVAGFLVCCSSLIALAAFAPVFRRRLAFPERLRQVFSFAVAVFLVLTTISFSRFGHGFNRSRNSAWRFRSAMVAMVQRLDVRSFFLRPQLSVCGFGALLKVFRNRFSCH